MSKPASEPPMQQLFLIVFTERWHRGYGDTLREGNTIWKTFVFAADKEHAERKAWIIKDREILLVDKTSSSITWQIAGEGELLFMGEFED